MYKQNLGFIAPFALNLLAYVLIWHFFFRDKEAVQTVDLNPVPIANIESASEAPAKAVFVVKESHFKVASSTEKE